MAWRYLVVLTLVSAGLTGCIGADEGVEQTAVDDAVNGLLAPPSSEALWANPDTAPHPAFGFPTLTHVPADAPAWWQPIDVAELPDPVSQLQLAADTGGEDADAAGGIAIFGRLAVVSAFELEPGVTPPALVYDISDPANPELLSQLDIGFPTRGVDIVAYPDGQLVAVFASDSMLMPVWDITDPTAPKELAVLEPSTASHNVAVVPGTPIMYNANTEGSPTNLGSVVYPGTVPSGITEIWDLSDPANPESVKEWNNGHGCHDITFYNDAAEGKHRAYCAGFEVTQIWDITDPVDPKVVVDIPVHHGNPDLPSTSAGIVRYSHLAMVNHDASVLIVGDETFGALAPGCDVYRDTEAGPVTGPVGNLYFYDITDETDPQYLSMVSVSAYFAENPPPHDGAIPVPGCTAHFGSIVPTEDREMLVMAFMGGGVALIDMTDATHPVIVDQFTDRTNTWDARYYNGYVFTGDITRGLDVLTFA